MHPTQTSNCCGTGWKVVGIVRRHEHMIREQGDQLVQPAHERDWAIGGMETVRMEGEEIRA